MYLPKNLFIIPCFLILKGSCQTECGYPCKIPFYYKNKKFEGCTKKDNGDEYWCATQINLTSTSKQWGPCNGFCPKDGSDDRYVRNTVINRKPVKKQICIFIGVLY